MSRNQLLAYATTAVGVSVVSLVAPSLPELSRFYGVGSGEIAGFQVAALVPGIISARVLVARVPRWGLHRMLAGTLAFYGLFGSSLLVVGEWWLALLLRALQGVAGGALVAPAFLLITSEEGDREGRVSRNSAFICIMMFVQPIVGSALAAAGGPRGPFWFYVLALPLAMAVHRGAKHGVSTGGNPTAAPEQKDKVLRGAMVATVTINILMFGWILYVTPVWLASVFGLDVTTRGWILSSQALVAASVAFGVSGALRRGRQVAVMQGGVAVAVLGLVIAAVGGQITVAIFGILLVGAGYGLTTPAILLVATSRGASGTASWQSFARLGQVAGPALAGGAVAGLGSAGAVTAGALIAAVGLVGLRVQMLR